eukprot:gene1843-3576_t
MQSYKFVSFCLLFSKLTGIFSIFVPPKTPNYTDLESWPSSTLSSDPLFIEACESMAGYYKDPKRNPALSKTIVIAGVNNGYADFLHNFKCYMDKLGIKFLPLSMDKGIYHYITENKISSTYLMKDIPGRDKVAAEPSGFGGKNFNLIGCRKMEAVAAALALGYNVLFSDVDIAMLRDPAPYIFDKGVDYVHSTNKGCGVKWTFNEQMEGNTGFYYAVSSPQTIRTWDLTYRACSRAPLYDDQTMFWLILRTNKNPAPRPLTKCPQGSSSSGSVSVSRDRSSSTTSEVSSCPLDDCLFSAGGLRDATTLNNLVNNVRARKEKAVAAHANWMNGKENKKAALQRAGLWIARRPMKSLAAKDRQTMGSAEQQVGRMGNWTCMSPTGRLV